MKALPYTIALLLVAAALIWLGVALVGLGRVCLVRWAARRRQGAFENARWEAFAEPNDGNWDVGVHRVAEFRDGRDVEIVVLSRDVLDMYVPIEMVLAREKAKLLNAVGVLMLDEDE